jgi:hypothetical protein
MTIKIPEEYKHDDIDDYYTTSPPDLGNFDDKSSEESLPTGSLSAKNSNGSYTLID